MLFLPYGRHAIDEDDIDAVTAVLRSDFLTTGPAVEAFELGLTERTGAGEAVACSSGTAALHLAVKSIDLGPGDWAIVPTITFVATANVVRQAGADVIFCDVDADTGLMNADAFEDALAKNRDKRIRAVLPVHFAGQPADPIGISAIARRENIIVIEDACHALGTAYSDPDGAEPIEVGACAHSNMAVFSFHPVKTIACGEGGAVLTRDSQIAKRLRLFRSHGVGRDYTTFINSDLAFGENGNVNPWYYEMSEPGYNYRLSDLNAALGLSQLGKLDRFSKARQEIVNRYDVLISDFNPKLRPLDKVPGCAVCWHLYPVLIDFDEIGIDRAEVIQQLQIKGIGSQVHFIPVSSQPYYQNQYGLIELPGAESYYSRTLSLPLFPTMAQSDADRVINALIEILGL